MQDYSSFFPGIGRYEGETYKNKMHGEGVAHFQGGHVYKVALLTTLKLYSTSKI